MALTPFSSHRPPAEGGQSCSCGYCSGSVLRVLEGAAGGVSPRKRRRLQGGWHPPQSLCALPQPSPLAREPPTQLPRQTPPRGQGSARPSVRRRPTRQREAASPRVVRLSPPGQARRDLVSGQLDQQWWDGSARPPAGSSPSGERSPLGGSSRAGGGGARGSGAGGIGGLLRSGAGGASGGAVAGAGRLPALRSSALAPAPLALPLPPVCAAAAAAVEAT